MDAVILDVGGVLLVPHPEPVGQALAPFGVRLTHEDAERGHYFGVQALDASEDEPHAERHAYLTGYASAVGVAVQDQEQALAGMFQVWRGPTIDLWRQVVSGSLDGLRRLAELGCKLGIVSNADGTIEEQLRRSEICQVGEGLGVPVLAIVDSTLVGVAKPAAEIFRHALEPIGVQPEQALYVGDTVRYDVRGARAAGLRPVHFDPFTLCASPADHPHIKTLAEVAALVL